MLTISMKQGFIWIYNVSGRLLHEIFHWKRKLKKKRENVANCKQLQIVLKYSIKERKNFLFTSEMEYLHVYSSFQQKKRNEQ